MYRLKTVQSLVKINLPQCLKKNERS
jgi:hypothetical protein